jgi:hypothetical protein
LLDKEDLPVFPDLLLLPFLCDDTSSVCTAVVLLSSAEEVISVLFFFFFFLSGEAASPGRPTADFTPALAERSFFTSA